MARTLDTLTYKNIATEPFSGSLFRSVCDQDDDGGCNPGGCFLGYASQFADSIVMEQKLLQDFQQLFQNPTKISLKPFSIARSLILNPSTSDHTISSILKTLSTNSHFYLLHVVTLLCEISFRRRHFSSLVTTILHSLFLQRPDIPPRVAGLSLSTLVSIASDLVPAVSEMTEGLFLSLCFGSCVPVRQRLLLDAEKFDVRPSILLTVLLGFTKDPYPYVRKAALDSLIGLCKSIVVVEDHGMVQGCYLRALELLRDTEESVRCSAVHMVSEWGKFLVAISEDEIKTERSDALYLELCSMVRDMSVDVRIEAFDALGKVGMASESILLKTLSKKSEDKNLPASSAQGAFVHGLEDEFLEVRRSACYSLRMPAIFSAKIAAGALNLLMDALNDDSTVVRLQALETMHHMAVFGHLKVQETHVHMFLGTLVDMNSSIRFAARKVLRSTNFGELAMFTLVVDSLIQSLQLYPQDEPDVLSLIFDIGRSHGSFAVSITKEIFLEMEPSSETKWEFNNSKNAVRLALAISAPLSHDKQHDLQKIPSTIFSYAVTMLGRISNGLTQVMNQDTLLAYLSHCSTSPGPDPIDHEMVQMLEDHLPIEINSRITDKKYNFVKFVLENIAEIWPLTKLGCISELLTTLRSWKEELSTHITDSNQSDSVLTFTLQYLHVVKLLSKAWWRVLCPFDFICNDTGDLGYILKKLEKRLRVLRYRFIGLSEEAELHIEELMLVASTLRFIFDPCFHESALLKKLLLFKETSMEHSRFVIELMKILQNNENSIELFRESLEFFTLKQLTKFDGNLRYMKAEVDIVDNHWLNPLPFVAGLPVGIPVKIRLQNTPMESKLRLIMTLDRELNSQYVFVDLKQFEGCDEMREFTFVAPFYQTPKVNSFTLLLSIGMECLSEEINSFRGHGGPKHEVVCLCKEKQVFLSMVIKQC